MSTKATVCLLFLLIIGLSVAPELVTALETYSYVSSFNGFVPDLVAFDVAVDFYGHLFVASYATKSIKEFNSQYGTVPFTLSGTFNSPECVALDGSGNLFIMDYKSVRKFSISSGDLLATIGSEGNNPGQLLSPYGLTVDSAGLVYIADTMNCRVQKFALTQEGDKLIAYGEDVGGIVEKMVFNVGDRIFIGASDTGMGNLFVTTDLTWTEGMTIPASTIVFQQNGVTLTQGSPLEVILSAAPGYYDVVLDVNTNGV